MAITISGSGITSANIADGTIVNADIKSDAAIAASKLTGTGKVLQVVSDTKTDTASGSNNNATFAALSGLSASITPSSTSSKILIIVQLSTGTSAKSTQVRLRRNSSQISLATGDDGGSQTRITTAQTAWGVDDDDVGSIHISFLDSPSSTDSTTYDLEISARSSGSWYVNMAGDDQSAANRSRAMSSIVLMEIGA
jgi:hypothetical protein